MGRDAAARGSALRRGDRRVLQSLWRGKGGDPFELVIRREEQSLDLVVLGGDRQAFFPSRLQGPRRTQ